MSEFRGDAAAVARQRRLVDRADRLDAEPWLASAGRLLVVSELSEDTLAKSRDWLDEDGLFGAVSPSRDAAKAIVATALGPEWRLDAWRSYFGDADVVCAKAGAIVADQGLPAGWSMRCTDTPTDAEIDALQVLNEATGVSPSPAASIRGSAERPALTAMIEDETGRLRAGAWAGMFFHPGCAFGQTVFVGLVSVDPEARGLGLGKLANALALCESQTRMGWQRATEFVADDNPASIGMVTASGLTWDGSAAAVVISKGQGRFTR